MSAAEMVRKKRSRSRKENHPHPSPLPQGGRGGKTPVAPPQRGRRTGGTRNNNNDGLTYAAAGVDIHAGDRAVELMARAVKKTHGPRVIGGFGGFAGMFRLDYNEQLFKRNYREPVLVACTDGVGTKVKLAAEMGVYDTVGIDCVAMNVNDMIVQGAEPLFFLDYLGLWKVKPETVAAMVQGVAKGCELAGCALLGGETAEMPDVYADGDFDIAGFAVGVVELERAVDPERVEAGDVIIGLASSGVHSNGYSLVRRIVKEAGFRLDERWDERIHRPPRRVNSDAEVAEEGKGRGQGSRQRARAGAKTLGEVLLEPTRIYAKTIVRMLKRYTVKKIVTGMAHITGSGIPGNLSRALCGDCDARVDRSSWEVPGVFRLLQEAGKVREREMWDVFNMGVGYCVIVRKSFADSVLRQLRRSGEKAWVMGEVVRGTGVVRLE